MEKFVAFFACHFFVSQAEVFHKCAVSFDYIKLLVMYGNKVCDAVKCILPLFVGALDLLKEDIFFSVPFIYCLCHFVESTGKLSNLIFASYVNPDVKVSIRNFFYSILKIVCRLDNVMPCIKYNEDCCNEK